MLLCRVYVQCARTYTHTHTHTHTHPTLPHSLSPSLPLSLTQTQTQVRELRGLVALLGEKLSETNSELSGMKLEMQMLSRPKVPALVQCLGLRA